MDTARQLWARVFALLERDRLDHDFDEEARSHLDLATEDYVQRGYPKPAR